MARVLEYPHWMAVSLIYLYAVAVGAVQILKDERQDDMALKLFHIFFTAPFLALVGPIMFLVLLPMSLEYAIKQAERKWKP